MSKLYQNKNKKKIQPPGDDLKPIQIDETIVSGLVNKQRNRLESSDPRMILKSMIEQMESLGLINQDFFDLGDEDEDEDDDEEFDVEEFRERVKKILGNNRIKVNPKTLNKYFKYLKENLELPCYLTGSEEFFWEEEYLYGPGKSKEYEELKKTYPSYTDIFILENFQPKFDEMDGIMVDVKRASDNRKFTLPLAELEVSDENSPNYSFIEDYLVWFLTYS
ncbi:MAG TPA: calcium-binding protein [Candidatus Obscuribacterales bacterium]